MSQSKITCPSCGKKFPAWYWAVSGKAGGLGTVRHKGLAWANYQRHVKSCEKKGDEDYGKGN